MHDTVITHARALLVSLALTSLASAGCSGEVSVIDGRDGGSRDGGASAADTGASLDASSLDEDAAITALDAAAPDSDAGAAAADAGTTAADAGTTVDGGVRPRAVAVAAGELHTCALLDDQRVFCWGTNDGGALGVSGTGVLPPTEVPGVRAIAIAAGSEFTCAVVPSSSSNQVYCWGRVGGGLQYAGPTLITGLGSALEIAAGQNHLCVRTAPGGLTPPLHCWGANHHGHVGDGTTTDRSAPVPALASTATHIGLGQQHSCAIVGAGASCWGWSHAGQAGTMLDTNPSPVAVSLWLADALPDEIDGGDAFTCARIGGRIGCWGSNALGQLGDPAFGASRLDASSPIGVIRAATALSVGGDAACVLETGGAVRCWGDNARGQVSGSGDVVATPRYVMRGGMGLRASDVSVGPAHTCAVTEDGDVACWGWNWAGALGDPAIPTGFGAGSTVRDPVLVVGLP